MKEFNINKEEWYKLRDDRTRRVNGVASFEPFSIGLKISPQDASSYPVQVTTLVTVNILSRWCKSISVKPIDKKSILPNSKGLDFNKLLLDTMTDSDPYGDFRLMDFDDNEVDLIINVGRNSEKLIQKSITIGGSGWVAGISNNQVLGIIPTDTTNPVGPSFAACLGSAYAFNVAVSKVYPSDFTKWYSLLDYTTSKIPYTYNPSFNNNFDFGRILQVGCGAVGSSLDYLVSLMKLKADLHIVDYDIVEPPNCSSSLAFTAYDSLHESKRKKIDVCHEVLAKSGIDAEKHSKAFSGDIYNLAKPDLILCLANEQAIWPTIQYNYPPLVYHATTTPNWGINFGRHIPLTEWCIVCRFGITDYSFRPVCSEVVVQTEEKQTLGVLPFLSPGAAIITLSEILKLSLTSHRLSLNFYQFSFKNLMNAEFIGQQRERISVCPICSIQNKEFYAESLRGNKYSYLSDQT